jgi:hypothetical protein
VKKHSGETSTTPITIRYSVNNIQNPTDHKLYSSDLRNNNTAGGYTYFLNNTDFNGAWQNRACLKEAIRAWVCNTGVNLAIGAGYTASKHTTASHTDNCISFGSLQSGVISKTYIYTTACSYGTGYHYPITRVDIVLSTAIQSKIWADPGHAYPIIPGYYDLQTIIEHELGHGIGLNHTVNGLGGSTDMMKFGLGAGEIRSLQTYDIAAGTYQKNSGTSSWSSGCSVNSVMTAASCFSAIAKESNSFEFTVKPNPFTNSIQLNYSGPNDLKGDLIVRDILGKVVYEENNYLFGSVKELNLEFLRPGVYTIQANNRYGTYTLKINKL